MQQWKVPPMAVLGCKTYWQPEGEIADD